MPNPKSEERDAQLPNPKSPNATCHASSTLAVSSSPSRNYFFIVFATCLALIFVGGLVFGRLSKRVRQEYKDR